MSWTEVLAAPPLESCEADAWRTSTKPLVTVCPDCASSPETRQRVVEERARDDLALAEDPGSSVLSVGGVAKPIIDCTREAIDGHSDHLKRVDEQDKARGRWLEERIAVLEARGEGVL